MESAACARLQKAAWVRSRGHTQQGPRLQKTQNESPAMLHLPGFWSRLIPPQERSQVSHPCALGPERSAPCPGSRSVSPEDRGLLQSPLHPVSPVRDGGPSVLFYQRGPCSVALGSHHPPTPSGSPTPKRDPGGITQPQGVSLPKALGSQDRLLARWAGSLRTALTSRQVPSLGCGQAPPLAADRSRVHVGMGATGSLVWLTHNPGRVRRPSRCDCPIGSGRGEQAGSWASPGGLGRSS